jgi:predicted DNA binding CopG/RHH family protein
MKRKSKEIKEIPVFNTEDEERDFWSTHDATDYFDFENGEAVVFPNLKPSTRSISIRLPEALIGRLQLLANIKDVPYQSLIKIYLAEIVEAETILVKKWGGSDNPQKVFQQVKQRNIDRRIPDQFHPQRRSFRHSRPL